jgi:hypothetical protein
MTDTDTRQAVPTEGPATDPVNPDPEKQGDQPGDPGVQGEPGEKNGEKDNEKAKARAKAPDTSKISADAINAATLAVPDLVQAAQPMRERSDEQKVMDKVAEKAYAEWVKADRPSTWGKVPVVTYFLSPEDVPAYRYLIRRACAIVPPDGNSFGVRVRFGNEFTLSQQMAEKIGRPDDAGKTVLAWAAVDKRATEERKTETAGPANENGQSPTQAKAGQRGKRSK